MDYLVWIQPTGRLHIGNYFGAIKPWLDRNKWDDRTFFMVAHYHSGVSFNEAIEFAVKLKDLVGWVDYFWYLGNLGNNLPIVYKQEIESVLLSQELSHKVPVSWLERLPQYKTKEKTLHMLSYPLLMACDIINSWCDAVIVWTDQIPHIQFYNDICEKFGYKKAEAIVTDVRIMSIKDPTKKMSKSLGDEHCIYLDDTHEDIHKKIMSAPTTKEGIENLKNISKLYGTDFDENNCKSSKENLIKIISNYNY